MKTLQKQYYIYVHCRPDGVPFYVGKGCENRGYKLMSGYNTHHNKVVELYGEQNILIFTFDCDSAQQAKVCEKWMIAWCKEQGYKITNMNNGGGGVNRHTDEAKEKNRQAHKGKKLKPLSAEHRAKLCAAGSGKTCSEETRQKLINAKLGKIRPELRERPHSTKHKQKIAKAMRLYWKVKKQ